MSGLPNFQNVYRDLFQKNHFSNRRTLLAE